VYFTHTFHHRFLCPFCGESKGKLNLKKNVFKCNRCGESGGMLSLFGKIYGVDNQTACKEIKNALGKNEQVPSYQVKKREIAPKEPEIPEASPAPDAVKHKTYSMFFSMKVAVSYHSIKNRKISVVQSVNDFIYLFRLEYFFLTKYNRA